MDPELEHAIEMAELLAEVKALRTKLREAESRLAEAWIRRPPHATFAPTEGESSPVVQAGDESTFTSRVLSEIQKRPGVGTAAIARAVFGGDHDEAKTRARNALKQLRRTGRIEPMEGGGWRVAGGARVPPPPPPQRSLLASSVNDEEGG